MGLQLHVLATGEDGRRVWLRLEYARRCTEVAAADYGPFRDAVQKALPSFKDDLVFAVTRSKK